MMDLTEQLICDAIEAIGGGFKREFDGKTIDFTPPFKRATYAELFQQATGVDPSDDAAVIELAGKLHLGNRRQAPRRGPQRNLRRESRGHAGRADLRHRLSR